MIEQSELVLKRGVTIFGQGADQVFNHCTQPPYNLNAIRTVTPKFGAGQIHEILPVGCTDDDPEASQFIGDTVGSQVSLADAPEQAMKLVDCQDRRGRIIDGRRERFQCDIEDNPDCKGWILLQRTFNSKVDRRSQYIFVNSRNVAV